MSSARNIPYLLTTPQGNHKKQERIGEEAQPTLSFVNGSNNCLCSDRGLTKSLSIDGQRVNRLCRSKIYKKNFDNQPTKDDFRNIYLIHKYYG